MAAKSLMELDIEVAKALGWSVGLVSRNGNTYLCTNRPDKRMFTSNFYGSVGVGPAYQIVEERWSLAAETHLIPRFGLFLEAIADALHDAGFYYSLHHQDKIEALVYRPHLDRITYKATGDTDAEALCKALLKMYQVYSSEGENGGQ